MELKGRFLKYVSFDTQSDESSETFPSTAKQRVLLDYLAEEMKALGLTEVTVDKYGYAMGTIPATPGCEKAPVIGFIAHVDTAPDMSGADVKPHVIENYDGKDIRLNAGVTMKVADFPELSFFKGHTLIHTDGTTLLGADDKAGVAEIMTAAEYLLAHPELRHGKIRIGFTPDEEIGRGVDFFDCVYPSRNGRHGHVYTNQEKMNLFNQKYELDPRPIEEGCQCPACRHYSRAYIRHLLKAKEMLGMRLCVLHNLYFYNHLMERIREALDTGQFQQFHDKYLHLLDSRI